MNRRYNQPMYQQLPAMAVEAHCQQSMYQQHTYMDRSRMAVTDTIYVQEHVSQSSWAMSAPSPRMRTPVYAQAGRAPPYMGNGGMPPQAAPSLSHPCPPPPPQASQRQSHAYAPGQQPGRFGYVPNIQYYASSSASMNTNGQLYVLCCAPSPNRPQHQQQMTKDNSTQTQGIVKRSRDASTQTDLIGDAPPMPQPQQEMGDNKACNNNTSLFDFIGDGQQYGTLQGNLRNSEVLLPKQRLKEITHISLYGSSIAEQVASAHRQRPCFKKMDTLCARLKQDLLRPDGVLPNINSQGIAWAVKDFIFVFTRIVNSWILLKGYVYNTPEGLNKIKDELPDGFMGAFDCWQITTLTMVEMIIKSFVNLDAMLQNQKNSFTKMDMHNRNCNNNDSNNNDSSSDSNSSNKTLNGIDISTLDNGPNAFSTPRKSTDPEELNPLVVNNDNLDDNNMNYLYTMVQDSEEAQRCVNANGTYLKTGTYTPLLKEANPVEQSQLSQSPPKSKPMDWKPTDNWQQPVESAKAPIKIQLPKLKAQCRHKDVKPYSTQLSVLRREMTRKLVELSNRIMLLQHIDRFFQKQFTLNYYPYFYERCHSEFIDVRAIILKCESASYQHISQPVHDLRRIIFLVRRDLKDHTNMDLRLYTALYERAINEMLSKSPYQLQQFEHITGNPIEKIFSSDI